MKEKLGLFLEGLRATLTDDAKRSRYQYERIYILLSVISVVMTVVNIITNKSLLMCSTLIFAALCSFDYALCRLSEKALKLSSGLLIAELIALFTFFIISGEPEGFAAIWACLLPACGMVLYGRRTGTIMSVVMLAILIFLLWIPQGYALCFFNYTASFRLRFPLLYCASFMLSLFLEIVREMTQSELDKIRQKFEHLSLFDQLTGLYNRMGFEQVIVEYEHKPMSCLMLDLDYFKNVNDTYGHAAGDAVLRDAAKLMSATLGEKWTFIRWGGEEFVALADRAEDPVEAAEKLCSAFRENRFTLPDGTQIRVTTSVGVFSSDGTETTDAIMSRVDDRLYQAKEAGRDRFMAG